MIVPKYWPVITMAYRMWYILILLVILNSFLIEANISNVCGTKTTCSECLNVNADCAWCKKWDLNIKTKCNTEENLRKAGCESKDIERSEKSVIVTVEDQDFQDITRDDLNDPVQIKPQHIKMKIRPNQEKTIKIQIRPAKNYPLDLYLLIDASSSMRDDIYTIASLKEPLIETLKTLTDNHRLGFGAFSDKPEMPWSFTNPERMKNPCELADINCIPPFCFRHLLRLTNDAQLFMQQVNRTQFTGSNDNLDGALDALMQIVACENPVGWKNNSRKVVIVATNSLLHFAGDGLLGGIIRPNDGMCHLDSDGWYADSLSQDYPSLSQILEKLKKTKTNVIFAVPERFRSFFDELPKLLPQFTRVGTLAEDSSNIIDLLKKFYEDIFSRISLQDNSTDVLRLTYDSKCKSKKGNVCENVIVGETYNFSIKVQFSKCPTNRSLLHQTIVIDETNMGSSSAVLDIELICGCSCEDIIEYNSTDCNSNGNEVCGKCSCHNSWLGNTCECNTDDAETSFQLQKRCFSNAKDVEYCSGRGECFCGKCECEYGFSGEFCECNDCLRENDNYCSDHGNCVCGECICYPGYVGPNCQCTVDNSTCTLDGEVCSNRGQCMCGVCVCDNIAEAEAKYSGRYCEYESNKLCELYENCVYCVFDKKKKTCDDVCYVNGTAYKIVQEKEIVEIGLQQTCTFSRQIDGSFYEYNFIYITKPNYVEIHVQEPEFTYRGYMQANLLSVGTAIVFGLVFTLMLCVVLPVKIHRHRADMKEFAKFEESRKVEMFHNENPLYKDPVTRYEMPTFSTD